jgi:hypothetical protein
VDKDAPDMLILFVDLMNIVHSAEWSNAVQV